jgi:hypothetical protein
MSECCYFVLPLSCLETGISGAAEISALLFLSHCSPAFPVKGPKNKNVDIKFLEYRCLISGCLEQCSLYFHQNLQAISRRILMSAGQRHLPEKF